jgi:integrase
MGVKKRSDKYHYKFMIDKKYYTGVCKNCSSKEKAEKYEREVKADIRAMLAKEKDIKSIAREYIHDKTGAHPVKLADAFQEYLQQPAKKTSGEAHTRTKESYWKDFVAFMEDKYPSTQLMDEVTSNQISKYLGHLQTKGRYCKDIEFSVDNDEKTYSASYKSKNKKLSPRTYNFVLGVLKDIFNKLSDVAGIIIDPLEKIDKMAHEQEDREYFNEEELKLIAEKEDGFVYPIFAIGLNTAFREGDICTLKWSDVNFKSDFIAKKTRKRGTKVLIPMLPSLKGYLLDLKEKANGSEYVLPDHAKMYLSNPSGINYRVKKFLEGIGIETRKSVKGRSRAVSVKDVHSLRHTFAYQAGLKGIPLLIVKDILGHMTQEMTELYQRHANMEVKREKMRVLEESIKFLPTTKKKKKNSREQLKQLADTLPLKDVKAILKQLSA